MHNGSHCCFTALCQLKYKIWLIIQPKKYLQGSKTTSFDSVGYCRQLGMSLSTLMREMRPRLGSSVRLGVLRLHWWIGRRKARRHIIAVGTPEQVCDGGRVVYGGVPQADVVTT